MDRQPISREGYDKKREEIRVLEQEVLPDIAEKIKLAREEGDLKENAEYHAQREQQGMTQAKINQLKSLLASCYIVDKSNMPHFDTIVANLEVGDQVETEIPRGTLRLEIVAVEHGD